MAMAKDWNGAELRLKPAIRQYGEVGCSFIMNSQRNRINTGKYPIADAVCMYRLGWLNIRYEGSCFLCHIIHP